MSDQQTSPFKKINHALDKLESFVLTFFLLAMIGLACLQIILRNVFHTGIADAEPLLRLMVLWVGMIGAIAASRTYKHITIDVITRMLSTRVKLAVVTINYLIVACVSAIVSWHAGRFVIMDYEASSPAFGAIPSWVMELILPFAFGAIALRYAISFIEGALLFIREASDGNPES